MPSPRTSPGFLSALSWKAICFNMCGSRRPQLGKVSKVARGPKGALPTRKIPLIHPPGMLSIGHLSLSGG